MKSIYRILYTAAMHVINTTMHIASLINMKAALWCKGRKDWKYKLSQKIQPKADNQIRVWAHAASLGEFELLLPVLQAIKLHKKDRVYVVCSFYSPSGYEQRKNHLIVDVATYLPLDTPKNAADFIEIVKPDLFINAKYEFWLFLLEQLQSRGIPTFVVGARFLKDASYLGKLWPLLQDVFINTTAWFTQDEQSKNILEAKGCKTVFHFGDTRVDRNLAIAAEQIEYNQVISFKESSPVLILGSIWESDLTILLPALKKMADHWKLIIAPHEIEESILTNIERNFHGQSIRFSKVGQDLHQEAPKVLLIDNIGNLSKLYRYGDIAYVGGGFGSGLHNIYEPLAYKIPVIYGPRIAKFPEALEAESSGIGKRIHNSSEFEEAIRVFSEKNKSEMQRSIHSFFTPSIGAASKIAEVILKSHES